MARVESIESLADPRVADYRDLRDAALRRRERLFVVEGRGNVRTLIEHSPFAPRSVFVTPTSFEALGEVWKQLEGGLFDVYEILPGFILCVVAIVVGSLVGAEPEPELVARFE